MERTAERCNWVRCGSKRAGTLATLEEQGIGVGRSKETDLLREKAPGRSKHTAWRHTAISISLSLSLLNFILLL